MSESYIVAILLSLTGGFQDAYTYNCRGEVFANAQTGNIVLAGQNLASGQWLAALQYVVPILAFVGGVYLAQGIRMRYKYCQRLHWRQIILLLEIGLLFVVGLLPMGWNMTANTLVSLACALQVDSFRKIHGDAYATTMCIGNLRTATNLLYSYEATKDPLYRRKSLQYYSLILVFLAGAALGGGISSWLGVRAIWICCIGMLMGFLAMFIREEVQGEMCLEAHGLSDELKEIKQELSSRLKK